jgi:hypothetical protein
LQLSNLTNLCDPTKRDPVINKRKEELASKLTYTAILNPDIVYTVSVTAINDAGRGHLATDTQRTKEEGNLFLSQNSIFEIAKFVYFIVSVIYQYLSSGHISHFVTIARACVYCLLNFILIMIIMLFIVPFGVISIRTMI